MKLKTKKHYFFLFLFLGILISIFFGIYSLTKPQKKLPIYTPRDVNPELVDTTIQHIGNKHFIQDFSFINQNGEIITQETYKNKVYVADFFFTTCPTICPKMTDNMNWLQEKIKNLPDVMLLSHSVTPDIDSVPILKEYALEKGVIDSKWNLVTGDKKKIYYIARKSYLAVKTGKPEDLYDMVHTENFILVDKKRRIRGFYDGTNKEDVAKLYEDILYLIQK